jgi:hypothetical protein
MKQYLAPQVLNETIFGSTFLKGGKILFLTKYYMARHKRTRTKKRRQRGGFWPFTSSSDSTYQPASTSSWTSWFSSKAKDTTNSLENTLGNLSSSVTNTMSSLTSSSTTPSTSDSMTPSQSQSMQSQPTQSQPMQSQPMQSQVMSGTYGGKRRTKRRMKGGDKLGLTYYATPVSGIKMPEPTYWIQGGRKHRKSKRHTYKRRTK